MNRKHDVSVCSGRTEIRFKSKKGIQFVNIEIKLLSLLSEHTTSILIETSKAKVLCERFLKAIKLSEEGVKK